MAKRLLACLAAAAALGSTARAEDPTARGFDPDPARLALSLNGAFTTETAGAAPERTAMFGAVLDYTEGLLALQLGDTRDQLLESRLSLHLLGGWSLGWLELAAELPVALYQTSDFSLLTSQGVPADSPLVAPIATTALGDLRLGAKLPLLDPAKRLVGFAAMLDVRLPTGNPDAFMSDGFAVVPSGIATFAKGAFRWDAQVGYIFRNAGQYAQLVVHDGLVFGTGMSYALPPKLGLDHWMAIADMSGGVPRGYDSTTQRYAAPLSARAGVRAWFTPSWAVELGGGTGLGMEAGYGRESWRVFFGVRWAREPLPPDEDWDKDGVANAKDLCPHEAGPSELDGCPDVDMDLIPDREDRCPREPGPAENDGCPVAVDEPVVEIESERLTLKDSIQFDTAKDTIKSPSFRVLDQVAKLVLEHSELKKIRVKGHTDNVGSAHYNKDLSERRAASVVRYLAGKGIPRERLTPAGFGFEQPVASNATALGRAKNRRVEFRILTE
jgi:outer membrane protein OmpA-like peptidoglycan-associated protein